MHTAVINGYGYKNLFQKQAESDKKAFPIILETLRNDLRNEVSKYEGQTIHSFVRLLIAIHIEKAKFLEENNTLSQTDLLAIHTIKIEDICRYMCDFRRNNPDVSLRSVNNIRLIRISVNELIRNRIEKGK